MEIVLEDLKMSKDSSKVGPNIGFQEARNMKANFKMENIMELEFFFGQLELNITENS